MANKNTLWGGMLETFTNGFKKVGSSPLQTRGEWGSDKSGVQYRPYTNWGGV